MRKFMREHGFSIITAMVCLIIFLMGFVIGRYAKAAPSLEVAENYKPLVEVEKKETETTEPETTTSEVEQVQELKAVTVKATAYCPCEKCCNGWAAKRPVDAHGNPIVYTASGTVAKAGRTVAVDPDVFPYGTELVVNGNTYVAEDTGGKIKGNYIDIYFDDHEKALAFGVQEMTVFVNE